VKPDFMFVVLNRFSTETLIEEISKEMVIELNDNFVMYKNKLNEVHGLWFCAQETKERFYAKIKEMIEDLKNNNGDNVNNGEVLMIDESLNDRNKLNNNEENNGHSIGNNLEDEKEYKLRKRKKIEAEKDRSRLFSEQNLEPNTLLNNELKKKGTKKLKTKFYQNQNIKLYY